MNQEDWLADGCRDQGRAERRAGPSPLEMALSRELRNIAQLTSVPTLEIGALVAGEVDGGH